MTLYIESINEQVMTDFFLSDPTLCAMGLGDECLKDLDAGLGYRPEACAMFGYYNEQDELVCCSTCTLFTESTLLCHQFIRSDLHHKGLMREVVEVFSKHVRTHLPSVVKLMTLSPSVCFHVHKAAEGIGFIQEGCITKAMIWRGQLVDIFVYGKSL